MIKRKKKILGLSLAALMTFGLFVGCGSNGNKEEVSNNENIVNVYSSRHYDVDKELFKKFEEETGIKVNLVEGKSDELIERMAREGENSPVDVFLTVGAENISLLKDKDLISEVSSEKIEENIPEEYRGKDWVGLTSRARVIVYNKDKVNPDDIKTYDDLLKDEFKGKVLVRSSSSSYNVALLSSFIQLNGEEKGKEWAEGLVKNFAREPEGNDRDQGKGVKAGIGDVGIMNSYYIARMLSSSDKEEVNAAKSLGVIFPEDTHMNLSFGAISKNASHKENGIKLLEFLTSEEAQKAYAEDNGEFALNKNVKKTELQKSWGEFTTQKIDFEKLGENKEKAVLIFDQIGWK